MLCLKCRNWKHLHRNAEGLRGLLSLLVLEKERQMLGSRKKRGHRSSCFLSRGFSCQGSDASMLGCVCVCVCMLKHHFTLHTESVLQCGCLGYIGLKSVSVHMSNSRGACLSKQQLSKFAVDIFPWPKTCVDHMKGPLLLLFVPVWVKCASQFCFLHPATVLTLFSNL